MAGVLAALRPEPHRGDQVAAGVVVLAVAIYVLEIRFADTWGAGIHFVIDGLATFAVGALAVQSPLEGERPRAFQSVLYIATFFLAILTLANLADILGADDPLNASGTLVWIGLLLVVLCAWFSTRRNSAIMTLLGVVTFGIVVEAFIDWVFNPHGITTFRWILLLLIAAYALGSLNQRGARPRHAVQFVNAAGLAAILLAVTFVFGEFLEGLFSGGESRFDAGTGWELVLLACGFGLVAYAGVDREPGPGYLGVAVLLLFAAIAGAPGSGGASLIGWPLVLILLAGGMLAIGLRPSHPLPPSPDAGRPPPPPPAPMPVTPQSESESPTDSLFRDPPTEQIGGEDPTEVDDR
jgi:hypothetical protein